MRCSCHVYGMDVTTGMHTHWRSLRAPTEVAYLRLLVLRGIYMAPSRGHAEWPFLELSKKMDFEEGIRLRVHEEQD